MSRGGADAPELDRVRRAALHAVPYLVLRQGTAQVLNIAGAVVLARWVSPADLGVFALVVATHGVLIACSGQGLLAGLVRAADEPDRLTLQTGFTIVQVVGAIAAVACWWASPRAAAALGLDVAAGRALQLAGVAAFVATTAVVPATLLERRLAFATLSAIEVSQVAVFHVVNLGLIWTGFGALSTGVALLARALAGGVVASALRGWPLGYAWSATVARRLLRFGGLYQSTVLINLLRDGVTPMLVGLAGGTSTLGLVTWAQAVASVPATAVGVVTRVLLPAFARLQHDRGALGQLLAESITVSHAVAAPLATLGVVLIAPLVEFVFGAAWRPAIPAFLLCSVASLFAPTVAPVLALHNAIGRPAVPLLASLAWTAVLWGLGAPLVSAWGAVGFGIAHVATQAVNLGLFASARREAPFSVLRAMAVPWMAAAAVALLVAMAQRAVPSRGVASLVLVALCGAGVYAVFLRVAKAPIAAMWQRVRSS